MKLEIGTSLMDAPVFPTTEAAMISRVNLLGLYHHVLIFRMV